MTNWGQGAERHQEKNVRIITKLILELNALEFF